MTNRRTGEEILRPSTSKRSSRDCRRLRLSCDPYSPASTLTTPGMMLVTWSKSSTRQSWCRSSNRCSQNLPSNPRMMLTCTPWWSVLALCHSTIEGIGISMVTLQATHLCEDSELSLAKACLPTLLLPRLAIAPYLRWSSLQNLLNPLHMRCTLFRTLNCRPGKSRLSSAETPSTIVVRCPDHYIDLRSSRGYTPSITQTPSSTPTNTSTSCL